MCTCFNGHEPVPWYNRSIPGRYTGTIDALMKVNFFHNDLRENIPNRSHEMKVFDRYGQVYLQR